MKSQSLFTDLCPALVVLLAACGCEPRAGDPALGTAVSGLTAVADFGTNPGNLAMKVHVPAAMPARAPLVVAMHGCLMDAADYVDTGWNQLADSWKFYVVYPETSSNYGCLYWFSPSEYERDRGQAASIKQMVDYMIGHHDVDPGRIFVTGLSSGGAMAANLLAAYPELFAAGATMAGMPYRCAETAYDSVSCMSPGRDRTAAQWGDLARGARPGHTGPYPRLSIWQGGSDYTVAPANLTELMEQWTNLHGIDAVADATGQVGPASHAQYRDASGRTVVETWKIDSMGHGTAVDPGFEPANGCGQADSYVLAAGICSTYHAARFFGLEPAPAADAGVEDSDAGQGGPEDGGGEPADAGSDGGSQPQSDAGALEPWDAGNRTPGSATAPDSGCGTPGTAPLALAPLLMVAVLARRRQGVADR